jgi:hypothetical protein
VRIPQPPAVFVGRDRELARLEAGLARAPVALIYGVAGVGKSALACAYAARWSGCVTYHRAREGDGPEDAALAIARRLAIDPPPGRVRLDEALAAIGDRLDENAALLVLDDLHCFAPAERAGFLLSISEALVNARVIATSRERIGTPAEGPERLEIHLGGLDEPSARAAWSALDELYGEASGFERVWERVRGSPLLLRRAHAGGAAENDPIAAAIGELTPEERRIAAALALSDARLPPATIASLLETTDLSAAIGALSRRLVIERDADGSCFLHDLFRVAIIADLSDAERRGMHERLASIAGTLGLPPADEAREMCRHLGALGRWERAGEYLVERSTDIVREGGARELLRCFDALPREHRSILVQIERVRVLGRVLDLERGYAELERLVELGAEPRVPLLLAFGQLASVTCHLAEGERAIAAVLAEAGLAPRTRMLAETAWAVLRAHAGACDEARDFLERAIGETRDPVHIGNLHLVIAFTHWIESRGERSAEPLRRAIAHLDQAPAGFRKSFFTPLMVAGVEATAGRFDAASAALAAAQRLVQDEADRRPHLEIRAVAGVVAHARGSHHEAVEQWRAVREAMDHAGYRLGVLWVDALMGRAMLELGWRPEALALLADAEARARSWHMTSMQRMLERARAYGPIAEMADVPARVSPDETASSGMTVDRRRHEIRTSAGTVSLAKRPILRRLLYALADRPGDLVAREDLVRRIWSVEYHPLVHDNALLVNVSRLRAVLASIGVSIVCLDSGYRVEVGRVGSTPPRTD